MAASLSDQYLLSQDSTFQHRVIEAAIAAAINIHSEAQTGISPQRDAFGKQVLNAPATWAPIWAQAVATDVNVIADATQGGTVVLTSGNAAAQAALVTDAHITTAVSAMWNAYAVRN